MQYTLCTWILVFAFILSVIFTISSTTLMNFIIFQLDISIRLGTTYQCFHNHLVYMLERVLPRSERRIFNALASSSAVIDYLKENLWSQFLLRQDVYDLMNGNVKCCLAEHTFLDGIDVMRNNKSACRWNQRMDSVVYYWLLT